MLGTPPSSGVEKLPGHCTAQRATPGIHRGQIVIEMPYNFCGLVLWQPAGNLMQDRFWSKFWLCGDDPKCRQSMVSETCPEWCSGLVIYG